MCIVRNCIFSKIGKANYLHTLKFCRKTTTLHERINCNIGQLSRHHFIVLFSMCQKYVVNLFTSGLFVIFPT